jgi:hypothetical protein
MAVTYAASPVTVVTTAIAATFIDGEVWASPAIQNASGYHDFKFTLKLTTSGGGDANGWVSIHIAESNDGGGSYAGGLSAAGEISMTPLVSNEFLSQLIPVTRLPMAADNAMAFLENFSIAAACGGFPPEFFRVVIFNYLDIGGGATVLGASGHELTYQGVNA